MTTELREKGITSGRLNLSDPEVEKRARQLLEREGFEWVDYESVAGREIYHWVDRGDDFLGVFYPREIGMLNRAFLKLAKMLGLVD